MNLFVKKVLAKYVKWIEIIGYLFVLIFIAGLIALSFIKAEEEYVTLKGSMRMDHHLIKLDKRHYIVDFISTPDSSVGINAPLMEVTDDERLIAEQQILEDLETQIEEAERASSNRLVRQLRSVARSIERKDYPALDIMILRTPVAGTFLMLQDSSHLIEKNVAIGGVFDYEFGTIVVDEIPSDARQWKKLEAGQEGTASMSINPLQTAEFNVSLKEISDEQSVFIITDPGIDQKRAIARALTHAENEGSINLRIHVGWKSWMRLIWR